MAKGVFTHSRDPYDIALRFWGDVNLLGACWLWEGRKIYSGYGIFWSGDRGVIPAHRWAYEYVVGVIPEGLELDHLCRVRNCVNPGHLEPVTHQENSLRAHSLRERKTHCVNGHELAVVGRAGRGCRACKNERQRLYTQTQKLSDQARSLIAP